MKKGGEGGSSVWGWYIKRTLTPYFILSCRVLHLPVGCSEVRIRFFFCLVRVWFGFGSWLCSCGSSVLFCFRIFLFYLFVSFSLFLSLFLSLFFFVTFCLSFFLSFSLSFLSFFVFLCCFLSFFLSLFPFFLSLFFFVTFFLTFWSSGLVSLHYCWCFGLGLVWFRVCLQFFVPNLLVSGFDVIALVWFLRVFVVVVPYSGLNDDSTGTIRR